ncbi:MAG: pyridoxine 5'-phosphate synthase [Arenimonas sp.]|nr:pyridoxine 5'-phosphate synthase [Arenimonas sp.]MBP7981462.1 pyridoxine 5'-phosphate synthase [Arenimonas sp.]
MTVLSVNVNKIAVLRNSRGGAEPSVLKAAQTVIAAGAQGITVHPRPDQRHIKPDDVFNLATLCHRQSVEYNIEGNPFAPERGSYPGLMELIRQARPTQATLVPDGDGQLTSDHGFDLRKDAERLLPYIQQLKEAGIRISIFMDAGTPDLDLAKQLGIDRIELYTGPFAEQFEHGDAAPALASCRQSALQARELGIGVNAGHDLSQDNLGLLLATVPNVLEVSIGHALIGEALYDGLDATVKRYLEICRHR